MSQVQSASLTASLVQDNAAPEPDFRALVDAAPEWIWEGDAELRLSYSSPACLALLGYLPEEMTGRPLTSFMTPEAAQPWMAGGGLRVGRRPVRRAIELRHKTGRRVRLEGDIVPVPDSGDGIAGYRGFLRDDTARHQAAVALQASEEKLRNLVKATADYVWEMGPDGAIRSIAGRGCDVLGYDPQTLFGRSLTEIAPPAEREGLANRIRTRLGARTPFTQVDFPARTKDGRDVPMEISGMPLFTADGTFDGYRGTANDISKRKRAEQALEYRDRILAAITQAAVELAGAVAVDLVMPTVLQIVGEAVMADRVVVLENMPEGGPRWLHAWHSPSAKVVGPEILASAQGGDIRAWLAPLDRGDVGVAIKGEASGGVAELLDMLDAQSILFVPIRLEGRWWGTIGVDDCKSRRIWSAPEKDTLKTFAELAGASIMRERHEADRKRAERELKLRSRRDVLTGLPNRTVFLESVERAQEAARRGDGGFAVHYVDLDHFKDVNDTRGHPIGDLLLKAVADRLRGSIRHGDVLARFGGDEFGILERGVREDGDAAALAENLLRVLKAPFLIGDRELHIGASIGVAVRGPGAADTEAEALLSHAELALYGAKSAGRQGYRFYTADMDAEARSRVSLADELRKALEREEFFLVYQPQVEMASRRIIGLEALVRWRHPERGIVGPGGFIPAMEQSGQIVQLGLWILKDVVRQTRAWLDAGIAPPSVSVNVSPVQFRQPVELERMLVDMVAEAKLPKRLLQLELTETTLMEATRAQSDLLERLHRDGFKISLDDFGTGYSSLSYLRRYPVDEIKIAQSFVAGVTDNPGDAAIVRAAISLARELGIQTMAEGAETAEQVKLLAAWGCTEVQGYYFSAPLGVAELEPMLRRGVIA